uniref:Zmp:0000001267 n=1 Tax=Neolamprologus brichardi TaxID=32507 RepID=A0A3Q4GWJ8_NEOBR
LHQRDSVIVRRDSSIVGSCLTAVMTEEKPQKLKLKRELGMLGAVSLIVGTAVGSGIFMTPQTVISSIGSPGASLVIWASCGLLAILASFCYAELGTVIKESGGEYIYIVRTSGPALAFMFIFSSVLLVRPAGIAGIGLSFATYVVTPFYGDCPPPVLVVKCVAAAAIITLAIVNCMKVRFAMSIQIFFTVVKVLALAGIIIGGVVMLIKGHTENFENSFENTNVGVNSIGIAFYQGLWSYDGWNNLNSVTEELKRPEVNLPRAVLIAISLVTTLYLLVNVSYLAVMTPKELMSSSAVALTCFRHSARLSRLCPPVATGGTACKASLHTGLHPPPPHSTLSRTEGWSRCRSGPPRWPQPCRLWYQCPLPAPGCTLSSSPRRRSSLGGIPGVAGSGAHRRLQWGRSEELQCHYLVKVTKTGTCFCGGSQEKQEMSCKERKWIRALLHMWLAS